jgi:hypothetical protein
MFEAGSRRNGCPTTRRPRLGRGHGRRGRCGRGRGPRPERLDRREEIGATRRDRGRPSPQCVDLGLAAGEIVAAHGGVGIAAGAELLQFLVIFGAVVERAEIKQRHRHDLPIERRDGGHRDHDLVEHIAHQVAQRHGADQRQEQERPRLDSVIAEGVGKPVAPTGQVERALLGDIDQPGRTHGCVDREPAQRLARLARLELEQIVEHHHRLAQVRQEVAQPAADRARHVALIGARERPDDRLVDRLGDREALLVDGRQRIAAPVAADHDDVVGRVRRGRGGLGRQRSLNGSGARAVARLKRRPRQQQGAHQSGSADLSFLSTP